MSDAKQVHWSNIDKRARGMIMFGLALGMLLAILDGTIVSTSLPTIIRDLGGEEHYSWAITGFMLCETIMIPISGKLSDLYGRKPLFLIGIAIFMTGSVLAGFSGDMNQFIIFRAMQGFGGGMLIPVATAAVADLYSPEERGKMQGILGSLFAVAMCLGPFLGGYITDNLSWHWAFFINIPLGIFALILTAKKFPAQEPVENISVDYMGIGLLSAFLMVFLLFFTWVGVDFEWASTETFIMVVASVAIMIAFIWNEFKAKDPVLNPSLFKNRTFVYCSTIMLIFGMGMMGLMMYLPLFMQTVVGMSPTNSGLVTLPLVIGIMITAMASGFSVKRTGYRPWLVVGPIIAAAGMFLLSTLDMNSAIDLAVAYLFVTGVGMGCMMSVVMIAAQNSAKRTEMGMTTSSVNLFRSIGSTVAISIFTMIINGRIAQELLTSPLGDVPGVPHTVGILALLEMEEFKAFWSDIISIYSNSVTYSFMIAGIIVLLVLAISIFVKGKPHDDDDGQEVIEVEKKHAEEPSV